MRIMNFSQFLNESSDGGYSSFEALPKPLKDFFIDGVGKNILSKVVGLKNFSIELQGSEIYFVINGNKILVPFVNYVYDQVVPNTEALKNEPIIYNFYNSLGMDLDNSSYRFYKHDINGLSRLFYPIFTKLRDIIKDDRPLLNPFNDIDLKNNRLIQLLDKLGAYIDTSDQRKKKGILRFSLKDFGYGLIIQPNGYMRIDYGDKTPILTTKMEITAPAYTEDDLNLKLSYLVVYLMKDILKKYNVPVKTINLLAKFYGDSDLNEYDNLIKEISLKYPGATSLLPDPNSVLNPSVKKGSSMLRRFGVI